LKRVRLIFIAVSIMTATAVFAASSTTEARLIATDRIPGAKGVVQVRTDGSTTTLVVELDDMKPALLFGGDYCTYVFWIVAPDGEARNMGEIMLDGEHGKLSTATDLRRFGMLVTAEPHFLPSAPSRFVVLKTRPRDAAFPDIPYRASDTPYNYERDTLRGALSSDGEAITDVHQALSAFRLAQRAHVETLLPEDFLILKQALERTLDLARESAAVAEVRAAARETVRLAVGAERLVRQGDVTRSADAAVFN
jgi:hypothetical protein